MSFVKSLITADGEVSSKRVAGLSLIALFMTCTIISACGVDINEHAVSLIKAALYTGGSLIGLGIAPEAINGVKNFIKKEPKSIYDEDE